MLKLLDVLPALPSGKYYKRNAGLTWSNMSVNYLLVVKQFQFHFILCITDTLTSHQVVLAKNVCVSQRKFQSFVYLSPNCQDVHSRNFICSAKFISSSNNLLSVHAFVCPLGTANAVVYSLVYTIKAALGSCLWQRSLYGVNRNI